MSPSPASAPVRPSISLLPASASDCPALADIYRRAFLPLPFSQALFGKAEPEAVARQLSVRFEKLLSTPRHVIHKAVMRAQADVVGGANEDGAGRSDEPGGEELIVGFAWWETPDRRSDEQKKAEREEHIQRTWADGVEVELVEALFADLDAFASTIERPHYHRERAPFSRTPAPSQRTTTRPLTLSSLAVHMLATDPSHQRTGCGSALVRWGMRCAEEEGVELYLDATAEGVPLYTHLGFVRAGEPIWLRSGAAGLYPMVNRPV